MRELEFLPAWYPQTRRRKRQVLLQAWVTVCSVIALATWLLLAQRNVHAADAKLADLDVRLEQTNKELAKLDELLNKQKLWRQEEDVVSRLGLHVETTRMFNAIEAALPQEMAILELSLDVDEQLVPVATLADAQAVQQAQTQISRRLKVSMLGVAPTDVDLANFLGQLSAVPFFENVAMTYAKDRAEGGHVMREFELTFAVNLNVPMGG
jgi:Tfp pilus assembly protein PilN